MSLKQFSIEWVELPISDHPYFRKRTKTGRPYKVRERILNRLIIKGVSSYLGIKE